MGRKNDLQAVMGANPHISERDARIVIEERNAEIAKQRRETNAARAQAEAEAEAAKKAREAESGPPLFVYADAGKMVGKLGGMEWGRCEIFKQIFSCGRENGFLFTGLDGITIECGEEAFFKMPCEFKLIPSNEMEPDTFIVRKTKYAG